ncbi:helix-turn-helix transcriptional regulator [Flagellimonas sp. HMM57]|uniref:response regulator transcription factor n=1 Tax=unclassified Flagellimonas TaxID=2644544 RepID=UPI0013D53D82|nr:MULTISPECIES: helix-turn-helix transcriptional regulator [unclassified Flagellimonas]UII75821.1 helix-turn-helix transcriptional regulator [Flagellimonas sp. HMM57]
MEKLALDILEVVIKDPDQLPQNFYGIYAVFSKTGSVDYIHPSAFNVFNDSFETMGKGPNAFLKYMPKEDRVEFVKRILSVDREKSCVLQSVQKVLTEKSAISYLVTLKWCVYKNCWCFLGYPINYTFKFELLINKEKYKQQFTRKKIHILGKLSQRELEVLKMVYQGCSATEIAQHMFLSPHTIEKHKKNIYKKLKISNKKELADFCFNFSLTDFYLFSNQ